MTDSEKRALIAMARSEMIIARARAVSQKDYDLLHEMQQLWPVAILQMETEELKNKLNKSRVKNGN